MKIQIELRDDYADLISDWASIARTVDAAIRAIEEKNEDIAAIAIEELLALKQPLHSVQMAVRQTVWANEPNRAEARKRNRL